VNERPHHINLLLLSKGDKFHYTLIKSLSRLVCGRTQSRDKAYVCPYCLHPFAYEHCSRIQLAKPALKKFAIINEDLVMVQLARKKILQNKPLYTGFVVLELSKVLMYDFHYNHIQGQYGADRARLLFTDTDSLCYQIETDDLYEDITKNL